MKKPIVNKHITVDGAVNFSSSLTPTQVLCIITNDELGKTLSLVCAGMQIVIPFEPIEKYLK